MTKSCKDAVKKKHTKWLKYQYCKADVNYDAYKLARNAATLELRKSKYTYEKDLLQELKRKINSSGVMSGVKPKQNQV